MLIDPNLTFIYFKIHYVYPKTLQIWKKEWRVYNGGKCCIFDNKQQKWCNCVVISGCIFSHKQWILQSGHVNSFLSIPLDFGQFTVDLSENKYSEKPKRFFIFFRFTFYIWHIHDHLSYSCVNLSFCSCLHVDFSSIRRWYPKSNESQKNSKFLQQINTCKGLQYQKEIT